jgi:hypothetical protein
LFKQETGFMWALPTFTPDEAGKLSGYFDDRSLWCLLLFPRAEIRIRDALEQNWDRFSHALGPYAHVITLLSSNPPHSGENLSFPADYEARVGKFCSQLELPLHELPALFLLNAQDGRGPPYWSLRRENLQLSAEALEALIGDISAATHGLPREMTPLDWRTAAAKKLLDQRSTREVKRFLHSYSGNITNCLSITLRLGLLRSIGLL